MKAKCAFTLIELLLVIAIIGILAALLLSVLGKTKDRARTSSCLNNFRQWGIAMAVFSDENEGFLPPEGSPTPSDSDLANPDYQGWYVQLPKVMNAPRYADAPWRMDPKTEPDNSIYICPSNRRRANVTSTTHNLFHYCLNGVINGTGINNAPLMITKIGQPASVVYLFDSTKLPAVDSNTNNPGGFVHTNLHAGGAQLLFLDGHAKQYKSFAYWDKTTGRTRTNNAEVIWRPW